MDDTRMSQSVITEGVFDKIGKIFLVAIAIQSLASLYFTITGLVSNLFVLVMCAIILRRNSMTFRGPSLSDLERNEILFTQCVNRVSLFGNLINILATCAFLYAIWYYAWDVITRPYFRRYSYQLPTTDPEPFRLLKEIPKDTSSDAKELSEFTSIDKETSKPTDLAEK